MSDFERIRRGLLKKQELFEDSDFPCTHQSIYYHHTSPHQFVWKRPHEITPHPEFLPAHANACVDIVPGRLGDQWLVSALAAVSLTRGLFYRVVPGNISRPQLVHIA